LIEIIICCEGCTNIYKKIYDSPLACELCTPLGLSDMLSVGEINQKPWVVSDLLQFLRREGRDMKKYALRIVRKRNYLDMGCSAIRLNSFYTVCCTNI